VGPRSQQPDGRRSAISGQDAGGEGRTGEEGRPGGGSEPAPRVEAEAKAVTAAASDLVAVGFTADFNGTLLAHGACRVELKPIENKFYEVRIGLDYGNAVTCVIHETALKVTSAALAADR
jgi:hypothetical protein